MFIAMSTVIATSVRRSMWPLNNNQKEPLSTPNSALCSALCQAGKIMFFSFSICDSTCWRCFSAALRCPLPASQRGDSIKYLPDRYQASSIAAPPSRNIIRQLKKAITTMPIAADSMGDQLPTKESRADHFPRTAGGINSVNEA